MVQYGKKLEGVELDMALIKCPECGRENVSDSAVACPDCGFNIREYFETESNSYVSEKSDIIDYNDTQKIETEAERINREREERNRKEEERLKELSQATNKKDINKEAAMDKARWEAQYKVKENNKKQARNMVIAFISCVIVLVIIVSGFSHSQSNKTSNTKYNSSTTKGTSSYSSTTKSSVSTGKQNALKSAKAYLNTSAFSKKGLISQLKYEGYSDEEANYAVENCGANWKEQAAKSAKAYLQILSFSRSGLIDQLKYEGFTTEEAEYGVSKNGY